MLSRAFALVLLLSTVTHAQGTRADYNRAATIADGAQGKVFRDRVNPRWTSDTMFWYRNTLANGKVEFVVVDVTAGTRTVVNRPLTSAAGADGIAPLAGVRPTRNNGKAAKISFVNQTDAEVRLFWVDDSGDEKPSGSVAPGATQTIDTYAGHVWAARKPDGKFVNAYETPDGGGTALIGAKPSTRPASATTQVSERGEEPGRPRRNRRPRNAAPRVEASVGLFVRDGALFARDKKTNQESRLAAPDASGRYTGEFVFSPDGRSAIAVQQIDAQRHDVYLIDSSPRDQLQPRLRTLNYLKPGDKIDTRRPRLFDLTTLKEIPVDNELFKTPWSLDGFRWDADSSRFTFVYNQRGHQVMRVIAVDASTGATKAVVEESSKTFIHYSGKFFLQWLSDDELLWSSERDGWNHLYLYDARAGVVKSRVTQGNWVMRGVEKVDEAARTVTFKFSGLDADQDPYQVHYARADFDGENFTRLTDGDGTHELTFSPNGKTYLDRYSRVDLPPVTELRRTNDGRKIVELEKADATALRGAGYVGPERFVAKGRDGKTDIWGVIHRPSNFDPAKKYPVIEDIYAGPQDAFVPKSFRPFFDEQRLAELGFVVVQIDGMGTDHRGKAFHDVCWKNLKDAGLPDRIAWIKAAAEKYPQLDATRVGIFGTSAGAQSALGALLFHGDFYKAAVSSCGCHDNRMDKIWWNEQWMGWPVDKSYEDSSNVVHAKNLHGNLMLIVGELDDNVDPSSTLQVADALIKADKDFDLLVIPGAGHTDGGTYGVRRRNDFFVKHLLTVNPPERD